MTSKLVKPMLAAAAIAAVATTAACGGTGDTSNSSSGSSSPKDVTISAPPQTKHDNKVTVKVSGPDDAELEVYGYRSGWSKKKKPKCTSNDDDPLRTVTMAQGGTQQVELPVEKPGRWWWVVADTRHDKVSECGDSSTKVKAAPSFTLSGPEAPTDAMNAYESDLEKGKRVEFWVSTDDYPPAPLRKGWPVEAKWVGPYSSTPEAKTSACSDFKKNKHIAMSTSGGHATPRKPGKLTVTPKKAGVYAVVGGSPKTKYSAAGTSGCDDQTPYLTVE